MSLVGREIKWVEMNGWMLPPDNDLKIAYA